MLLTFLDTGRTALSYLEQNRERLTVSYILFGNAATYTVAPTMSGLQGVQTYRQSPDSVTVLGDTLTITVELPTTAAFSFNEVAITLRDGTALALGTLASPSIKAAGTTALWTFTATEVGLGERATYTSNSVILSRSRPDFDDLRSQLIGYAAQTDSFSGLVTNETGNTLIELIAGMGDFAAYHAESAYQEAFPDTAKLDSSVYAIQRMLGNRLSRNRPASVTVKLTRTLTVSSLILPAYTAFACGATSLFNRTAIVFDAGVSTVTATLYAGTLKDVALTGLGVDYQFYTGEENNFVVSDTDVRITVNGTSIPVVTDGIWNYRALPAVQDATDKTGRLTLRFGTTLFGTRPEVTDTVRLYYVLCNGAKDNVPATGLAVSTSVSADITGIALSDLTGGGDKTAVDVYRQDGGHLYAGSQGAVTQSQYVALARSYPGVLDAQVLAQRHLAPMDKDWFNTAKVILLTSTVWSQAEIDTFTAWYETRTMYAMRYVVLTGRTATEEPKPRPLAIDLTLGCQDHTDLYSLKIKVETALRDFFEPRFGVLSKNIYRSDIINLVMSIAPTDIDYVIVNSPTIDLIADIKTPTNLTLTVLPGGSLNNSIKYHVVSFDADGESSPVSDFLSNLTSNKVFISWDAVPNATGYRVYSSSVSGVRQLVSTTSTSYLDVGGGGVVVPKVPSINTSGVHYASVVSCNVTPIRDTRRQVGMLS